MRNISRVLLLVVPLALLPAVGGAKGCIKGAAVGGVAGHVAGHHGVVGRSRGLRHRASSRKEARQGRCGPGGGSPTGSSHPGAPRTESLTGASAMAALLPPPGSARTARVFRGLYGPGAQPHVAELSGRHARHVEGPEIRL